MKHLLIALLSLISISSFSQIKIESINSSKLKEKRELVISLPASYEKNPTRRYPLLILLDGDYLLDPFLGTLNYGAYWDDLPEVVIVAINQNKKNERATDCGSIDETTGMPTGKSINFFDFVSLELIPYLNNNYRTTDFKIIAGHDTTAAFLNYFLYQDNPLFNAYISLSPELPDGMEAQIPEILSTLKKPIFYYLSTTDGDVKNMRERITKLDHTVKEIKKPDLNYKFENFKDASHFAMVLHSIPTALYQIFFAAQPISTIEYDTKIVTLKEGYVDYLKKKYDIIENSFGIKNPVRINDIKAIEAAILQNKDYNELDALAIIADKNYPKSMLGDYELALLYENIGDYPKAVRYYMSGFNKEEIADLTKDMMFAKAEELKKTFAKKPKIKGKVGQVEDLEQNTPASDTTVPEEKKQ
jgi:predicted alpha/beta superfamily hydrolase